jgi:hypothetical protein
MPKTEIETTVGQLAIGLADTSQDEPVSVVTLKQINFCLPDNTALKEEEARSILSGLSVYKTTAGPGVHFEQRSIVSSVETEIREDGICFVVTFKAEFASAVAGFQPFCA